MDKPQLTAANLVQDWLDEQFPNDFSEVNARTQYGEDIEYEIMVDGIGIGEMDGITLRLLDPRWDVCTVVSLANPESLPLLGVCIKKHLASDSWGHTMKNNKAISTMMIETSMTITHRSSMGYRMVWK